MDTIIPRYLTDKIQTTLKPQRVIGLFGARRTGKTKIMEIIKAKIESEKGSKVLFVQGDNLDVAEVLSSRKISVLKDFLKNYNFLFIDEAQKVPHIGDSLKLIVDSIKNIKIFISGSSSLDLKQKVGEPLTGRSVYFYLYPIAQMELNEDYLKAKQNLDKRLIFGSYPQVITARTNKERMETLKSIRDGYLLRDVLELDNLKDSLFILNLLRLIAFQIGNDISYSELASNLNVNKKTVMRYLNILEKCYILFSLYGFSRNLRKEYSKTPRYFFWDNGIRNILIANFNPLHIRNDVGKLWENYCIAERIKKTEYSGALVNRYFWRTYDQKEIDLIEEKSGKLNGYEFKWKETKASRPKDFLDAYHSSKFDVINRENYLDFIS